jgi:hypothetical protein
VGVAPLHGRNAPDFLCRQSLLPCLSYCEEGAFAGGLAVVVGPLPSEVPLYGLQHTILVIEVLLLLGRRVLLTIAVVDLAAFGLRVAVGLFLEGVRSVREGVCGDGEAQVVEDGHVERDELLQRGRSHLALPARPSSVLVGGGRGRKGVIFVRVTTHEFL